MKKFLKNLFRFAFKLIFLFFILVFYAVMFSKSEGVEEFASSPFVSGLLFILVFPLIIIIAFFKINKWWPFTNVKKDKVEEFWRNNDVSKKTLSSLTDEEIVYYYYNLLEDNSLYLAREDYHDAKDDTLKASIEANAENELVEDGGISFVGEEDHEEVVTAEVKASEEEFAKTHEDLRLVIEKMGNFIKNIPKDRSKKILSKLEKKKAHLEVFTEQYDYRDPW